MQEHAALFSTFHIMFILVKRSYSVEKVVPKKRRFALPASRQRTPSRRRARSTPGRRCTAFCCSCGTSARSRAAAGGPSCRILLVGGGSDSPHRLAPPHSKTKPTARSAAADRHPVRGSSHSKPSRSNRIVPFAVPSLCYIKSF